MPKRTFAFGDHEIIHLTAGYAPTDFMSVGASFLPLSLTLRDLSNETFWSIGAKIRLIKSSGLLRGLALGADMFTLPDIDYRIVLDEVATPSSNVTLSSSRKIYQVNLAASLGNQDIKVHANFVHAYSTAYEYGRSSSYIQVGGEYLISKKRHR